MKKPKSVRKRLKSYTVPMRMTQVFTDEIEIKAASAAKARRIAKGLIEEDGLASLEFQDLESTAYQVGRAVLRS